MGSSGSEVAPWVGGQSWLRGRAGACFCGYSGCHPWRREEAGGLISNQIRQEAANREAIQKLICNMLSSIPCPLGGLRPGSSWRPQLGHFAGAILDPLAHQIALIKLRGDGIQSNNSPIDAPQCPSGLDTLAAICESNFDQQPFNTQNSDDSSNISGLMHR